MSDNKQERILCAAIHFDDGQEHVHQPVNIETGFVVCGMRHHNCYATLVALTDKRSADYPKQTQGFITTRHRFVNRRDAFALAQDTGQIGFKHNPVDQLMSEDLY